MIVSARVVLAALLVGGVLSGCGDERRDGIEDHDTLTGGSSTPVDTPVPKQPTQVPAAPGLVLGGATVLDDGDGAELCLGGVAESLPPQCGGPPLIGWDWADHEGDFEEASGVKWGDFVVTGTFDGTSVTPTEVVPADEFEAPDWLEGEEDVSRGTPCPEPDGGWGVIDRGLTNDTTMDATFRTAEKLDDYADSWVDQSINPYDGQELTTETVDKMNDPTMLIINVRVTGDPAVADALLRQGWGGALCVSTAVHTQAELLVIQREVNELPGMSYSAPDDDVVELGVTYDDGSIQDWVDATYGEGVVVVSSSLQDVPS